MRLRILINLGLGIFPIFGINPAIAQSPVSDVRPTTSVSAPPAIVDTPGLRATQVSLVVERNGTRRQFRGTVMARVEDGFLVLTAAHCMGPADQGGSIFLRIGDEVLEGTVESVVRNPLYHQLASGEIPGPDNAVARLRFAATNQAATEALRSLKTAPAMTAMAYPSPAGQTVSVRMIDRNGVEHAVRAGNYKNPRWLVWGPGYRPIPGDSGGGVFVVRQGPDGHPRAILIGIIAGSDERGGGASLVSLDQPWLAAALPH
jgi:hypothetical protein